MGTNRTEKLNSELKKNIYRILTTQVKNPNITEMFSITDVTCDSDLTYATVYVSIFSLSVEAAQKTFLGLKSAAPYVRRLLLKSMRIKSAPELHFVIDDRMSKQDKILNIMSQLGNDEQEQ